MKDGLKWVILAFVAALLILLVVTQKDKLAKVTEDTNTGVTSGLVNNQDDGPVAEEIDDPESGPVAEEEFVDTTEVEFNTDIDPATGEEQVVDVIELVEDVVRVEGRKDENGVDIAP